MDRLEDGIRVKNQRRLSFNDFEEKNLKYQIKSIHETDNSQFNRALPGYTSGKPEVYDGFTRIKMMNPPENNNQEG